MCEGLDSVSQYTSACLLHWPTFATGQVLWNSVMMNVVERCEQSGLVFLRFYVWLWMSVYTCVFPCLLVYCLSILLLVVSSVTPYLFSWLSGFLDQFRMASCDSSESHGDSKSAETEGEFAAQKERGAFCVCVFVFVWALAGKQSKSSELLTSNTAA